MTTCFQVRTVLSKYCETQRTQRAINRRASGFIPAHHCIAAAAAANAAHDPNAKHGRQGSTRLNQNGSIKSSKFVSWFSSKKRMSTTWNTEHIDLDCHQLQALKADHSVMSGEYFLLE